MFPIGNADKNYLVDEHAENKYYDAEYDPDINDKNDSRALIADPIKNGSVCLDVGCGGGCLGQMLSKFKKVKLYGVELDKEAIKYARKKGGYTDLYNFSITERKGKEYDRFVKSGLKFDYIVFADLLEHVVSPDDIILFFSKFLKPNGKFLVSLPNVAHFDIARGLINRNFNYSHVGLLDNTHLRFYTKRSFSQLIEQMNKIYDLNLSIKIIGKTKIAPGYIYDYPELHKMLDRDNEACVMQFIYEISNDKKKKKNTKKEDVERDVFGEIEKRLERQKILEKEVADLRASTSWKITKPIRKVSAIFKREK